MGSGCSHSLFYPTNIDSTIYTDKSNIWNFQVADGLCKDCGEKNRLIKKICIDHGIEQPWEILDPKTCQHEVVMIRRKLRDGLAKRYNGRAECVGCLVNIPVYIDFEVKNINNKKNNSENDGQELDSQEIDVQITEWDVDQIQLARENKK